MTTYDHCDITYKVANGDDLKDSVGGDDDFDGSVGGDNGLWR